jgi:hypothetical protein
MKGIISKGEELDEVLQQRHTKIAVISETKKNYTEIKIPGTTVQHRVVLKYKSPIWSDAMDT